VCENTAGGTGIKTKNHYVPSVYLKNFANRQGKVSVYRLLVAHPSVRRWQRLSPRGIAYHSHLYTRIVSGTESDEVEEWFGREFETPAEEALERATHDRRLTPAHWASLIRFAAAQDVRTPARLMEEMAEWPKTIPPLLDRVLRGSAAKLEQAKRSGIPIQASPMPFSEYVPLRLHKEVGPGEAMGQLRLETVAGRGLWLFGLRHLLTSTIKVLLEHHWTIIQPHNDFTWFTSDDPVIKLNFNSPTEYDLKGGWGSKRTEILLPLGPKHLLYAQVGLRPPARGTTLRFEHTLILRRIIAEHAHRMIFAAEPSPDVTEFRPRLVDSDLVRSEREQWQRWHREQMSAEQALAGNRQDVSAKTD
jgi:hypothetical protein